MTATATGLSSIEWGTAAVSNTALPSSIVKKIRKRFPVVPDWVAMVWPLEWIITANLETSKLNPGSIRKGLSSLVRLIVSQDNSCRHCYGAQRAMLKIFGYSEQAIEKLERDLLIADISEMDRAALEFVRAFSRANPLPGPKAYRALIDAGYTDRAFKEIAFLAAMTCFGNRVSTPLAVRPEYDLEAFVELPIPGFVRRFIAWSYERMPHFPFDPPKPRRHPFATLVEAFEGTSYGGMLDRILDDAWTSPYLSTRTKALIFAVLGRAIGCPGFESEALSVLRAEGLAEEDIDDILRNLSSDKLDEREAKLLPFARESVRYQAPGIQRRLAELSDGMSREEVLEGVGIAALGNAIARLSVVLECC